MADAKAWSVSIALGHEARRRGRIEEALSHYYAALRIAPEEAETNSVYGLMLLHANRIDEAVSYLERAIELDPAHRGARLNLAELRVMQNDIDSATRIVESLATETPQPWWLWDKLGELKARAGRFSEAAVDFGQAVERNPADPALRYRWARAAFDSGALQNAKTILDSAARLAPSHPAIAHLYAEIYERSSDWGELERIAQKWLDMEPRNPAAWMFVAKAQWEAGYLSEAMKSYRTFLDLGGRSATNLATFGRLCIAAHAYDDASRALTEAEQLDAECGHMLSAKAVLAMFRGEFDDARAYARRAIDVDARDIAAFKVLVQVSRGRVRADERAALERLSLDASLALQDRISASFALGDCLDAQDETTAAFAAYERANELALQRAGHEGLGYDPAARERQTDALMSIFSSAPATSGRSGTPIPIFIVGMPRSGTTLVESILGAHSRVVAYGERQEMRSIMQQFMAQPSITGMDAIPAGTKAQWREAYWRELRDCGGADAVTDKNPWNFDALGVIFELFPHARVVHVRRNPIETGLSIYRNEFPKFVSFSNRLEHIGHFYGQYARLMGHWETMLAGRFLTVQYERLVADFSTVTLELLNFCELEWEDACRDFSRTDRVIGTMSAVQARLPTSEFHGRSDRYERYLAPLVSALRDARVDLESGRFDSSASR